MGLVLEYTYGTAEILRYERVERGYVRIERYTPHRPLVPVGVEHRHCTGPEDVSIAQSDTDSTRCGWCYLAAPHTRDAHAQSVARGVRS